MNNFQSNEHQKDAKNGDFKLKPIFFLSLVLFIFFILFTILPIASHHFTSIRSFPILFVTNRKKRQSKKKKKEFERIKFIFFFLLYSLWIFFSWNYCFPLILIILRHKNEFHFFFILFLLFSFTGFRKYLRWNCKFVQKKFL